MKTRVLMATVGGAAAALAAGVMWTAPSASASSDFCDSLPPAQVHDCNCGADNVPGTQEYQQCLHGTAAVPGPASSPPPPAPPPTLLISTALGSPPVRRTASARPFQAC